MLLSKWDENLRPFWETQLTKKVLRSFFLAEKLSKYEKFHKLLEFGLSSFFNKEVSHQLKKILIKSSWFWLN